MATPQESITTVNGRRCTRSRARTAATPTSTPIATPTAAAPIESTTSAVAEQPPQTQQPPASPPASQQPPSPPPPPPAPPASFSPGEQSAIVPLPTSQAAATTALGTSAEVLISLATSSPPAVIQSSAPTPDPQPTSAPSPSSKPVIVPSQIAAAPDPPPARIAPTSSDTINTAQPGSPSSSPAAPAAPASTAPASSPPVAQPAVTESAEVTNPTSVAAVPDTFESPATSPALTQATSIVGLLSQTSSTAAARPTVGPVGIIAPEQGTHSGGDGHTGDGHSSSHNSSEPNVGRVVGGVIGGFVGLALLGVLVFFLLRRRKSRQSDWGEKSEESSGFASKLRAVPAGFGGFLARLRNEKTGPLDNPYQRHQPRSSVGSVYSTTSSGRGRSISEPQGQSAVGGVFVRRMSSRKSERNVLRKKTSSVSSQSAFLGIAEEPARSNDMGIDIFADPTPDTPRNLRISNPDTIEEQTRGPSPPQPAATPRVARDPFASLIDQIDGAPDWLRESNMTALTATTAPTHRRTQSSATALTSHPASSVYSRDPFADPQFIPPLPNQTSTSQPQPPLNTYSAFPAARESGFTFFGEPGPSRPGTNTFTPGLPSNPGASRPGTRMFNAPIPPAPLTSGPLTSTSRLDRQSDPFDLDRPEVLSFKGIMSQMRDSIARTTTVRSRRTSSIGNWFGRDASPAPPLNGASVRR